jgi:hypothetical protein
MPPLYHAVRNRFLRCFIDKLWGIFVIGALLIGAAGSASAQIYISEMGAGTVAKYDLLTGTPINTSFVSGLAGPVALALRDNALYVGDFLSETSITNRTYDATTGASINSNFFTSIRPTDYAFFGGDIFVVNQSARKISRYNASTGALVDANFITSVSSFVFSVAVAGNSLLVTMDTGGTATVEKYDANTGALINASFITGVFTPAGLLVSGSVLYVADMGAGRVGKYDAATGAAINASFITGLPMPSGLAEYDGKLYITDIGTSGTLNGPNDVVKQYDAATGALINGSFITGLNDPYRIVVVPEPGSTSLLVMAGMAWLGASRRRRG